MKSKKILKSKKGESLIESVIAVAIFAILATTLATLLINASGINKNAIKLNRANATLTQGIDGDKEGMDPTLPIDNATNPAKTNDTVKATEQEIKLSVDGNTKLSLKGTITETEDKYALDGSVKNKMYTFKPGA